MASGTDKTLRVHSIETLGGADGPGIRCIFFLQGCPLRCRYCHNPDTQPANSGDAEEMTPEDVLRFARRVKPYFGGDGGVTFSGGEPLLQAKALREAVMLLKADGIGVAIDTSGCIDGEEAMEAIALADLILLDIKHPDDAMCDTISGGSGLLQSELSHLKAAERRGNQRVWIRHVVMPALHAEDLGGAIRKLRDLVIPFRCVEKVELLPFHRLGVEKYEALGRRYPMGDIPGMDAAECRELQKILDGALEERDSRK